MGVSYLVSVSCDDSRGCDAQAYFPGTTDAYEAGWALMPGGHLCPAHAEEWRCAQGEPEAEPLDDLLA